MNLSETVSAIQSLLAPVLMISACGLLLLGMQNRYGRINDRLRKLSRERMALINLKGKMIPDLHLQSIDRQLPGLLKRNRLLQVAVLTLYLGVVCFVFVVFGLASALMFPNGISVHLTLWTFLLGQFFVLTGMILMAVEIHVSHDAVTDETLQIMKL